MFLPKTVSQQFRAVFAGKKQILFFKFYYCFMKLNKASILIFPNVKKISQRLLSVAVVFAWDNKHIADPD